MGICVSDFYSESVVVCVSIQYYCFVASESLFYCAVPFLLIASSRFLHIRFFKHQQIASCSWYKLFEMYSSILCCSHVIWNFTFFSQNGISSHQNFQSMVVLLMFVGGDILVQINQNLSIKD